MRGHKSGSFTGSCRLTDRCSEQLPVSKVHVHLLLQLVDVALRQNSAVYVGLRTTNISTVNQGRAASVTLGLVSRTHLPDGGAVLSQHAQVDAFNLP